MRGLSDPNIFLVGDLGVKKALQKREQQRLENPETPPCQPELAALGRVI